MCGCDCAKDDEDGAYARDPAWLKDLETAAAIAELRDAVDASTAEDDIGKSESDRLLETNRSVFIDHNVDVH